MPLADSVGAVCAFLNLPRGATTSTVSSTTSLVRGVRSGTAHPPARPAHVRRPLPPAAGGRAPPRRAGRLVPPRGGGGRRQPGPAGPPDDADPGRARRLTAGRHRP